MNYKTFPLSIPVRISTARDSVARWDDSVPWVESIGLHVAQPLSAFSPLPLQGDFTSVFLCFCVLSCENRILIELKRKWEQVKYEPSDWPIIKAWLMVAAIIFIMTSIII